jgi:hypothetical protein
VNRTTEAGIAFHCVCVLCSSAATFTLMDGLRTEQTKRNSRDFGKVLVTRMENLFKVPTVNLSRISILVKIITNFLQINTDV